VISGGEHKAGHYSFTEPLKGWQGGNRQVMAEIIQQINDIVVSNEDLVILNLGQDYNTDVGGDSYRAFAQAGALFAQLAGLVNLWVVPGDPTTVELMMIKLNDVIGGGRAAVMVIVGPSIIEHATCGFCYNSTCTINSPIPTMPTGCLKANCRNR
jgi:hypothetical protein